MNEQKIIRVFARKTKWTPTDDLAFYGEPPLFDLPNLPVHISVTFTWDIFKGRQLEGAWAQKGLKVENGGPAFDHVGNDFIPGKYIKSGVTFTSRGCPKKCTWCLVPKREGKLREITIQPGYIIQDNNLLACSRDHIEAVFEMLRGQKKAAKFSGGLDIDYLQPWHVDLLKSIKLDEIWVACDRDKDLKRLDKAVDLLSDFSIEKKRCYVLMAFNGDNPEAANHRCETIYEKGFLPFSQFYRPLDLWLRPLPKEWRYVQWKWSRPAAYCSKSIENIKY